MTAVILAQVAVDATSPIAAVAGELLSAFLSYAAGDVPSMLDDAVSIRRADPAMTPAETDRLDTASDLIRRGPASGCRPAI